VRKFIKYLLFAMIMQNRYVPSQGYVLVDSEPIKLNTIEGSEIPSEGIEKILLMPLSAAEKKVLEKIRIVKLIPALKERIARYNISLGVISGRVDVYDFHTTTALLINELEEHLLEDIVADLLRQIPAEGYSAHDDFNERVVRENERKNSWSHRAASRYPRNVSLLVVDGEVQLGEWQSLMYFDFDAVPPQERSLAVQFHGSSGVSLGSTSLHE